MRKYSMGWDEAMEKSRYWCERRLAVLSKFEDCHPSHLVVQVLQEANKYWQLDCCWPESLQAPIGAAFQNRSMPDVYYLNHGSEWAETIIYSEDRGFFIECIENVIAEGGAV